MCKPTHLRPPHPNTPHNKEQADSDTQWYQWHVQTYPLAPQQDEFKEQAMCKHGHPPTNPTQYKLWHTPDIPKRCTNCATFVPWPSMCIPDQLAPRSKIPNFAWNLPPPNHSSPKQENITLRNFYDDSRITNFSMYSCFHTSIHSRWTELSNAHS